mmetsp:Transcript_5266/g.14949  ORF Transcript_5266/g.14949 Transcript_5266/m.14949 type:complete len:367 (+) Transcript_5266:147-1247(+)
MMEKNSARVLELDSKHPLTLLVTVLAEHFCTPRMTIQKWEHSTTTATPRGSTASTMASAICLVRRSCTCRRRENTSAMRAILERPIILPLGIYPMWTRPVKGTMWCSHRLWMSMSRTTTISLCESSVKTASFVTSAMVWWYPLLRKRRALAHREGVFTKPSRSGFSPMHSNMVRQAEVIFSNFSASAAAAASAEGAAAAAAPTGWHRTGALGEAALVVATAADASSLFFSSFRALFSALRLSFFSFFLNLLASSSSTTLPSSFRPRFFDLALLLSSPLGVDCFCLFFLPFCFLLTDVEAMDESSLTAADATDAVELTTRIEDSATLLEDDDAEEDEVEVVLTDDESSTSPAGAILLVLVLATLGMM